MTLATRLVSPFALAAVIAGCGETRIDADKAEGLIRDLVSGKFSFRPD